MQQQWRVRVFSFCVLAIFSHISCSHALLGPPEATHADTVAPVKSPEAIYTEGGGVIVGNASKSVVPESVHSTVRKRLMDDAPAPVVEPVSPGNVTTTPTTLDKSSSNVTTAKTVPATSLDKPSSVAKITSTGSPPVLLQNTTTTLVNNATTKAGESSTKSATAAVTEKIEEKVPKTNSTANVIVTTQSTTTKSSTSSSTSTTTTTTTTTPKPKKPTITLSLSDDPSIYHVPSKRLGSPSVPLFTNNLDVEEPVAQLSREHVYDENHRTRSSHRDLVIPVVSLIFAVPMLLGLVTVVARRLRDYWQTRHYRRMDFLVDGIYND